MIDNNYPIHSRTFDNKAQSEVISVILLTAIIVIAVGVFGVYYLDTVDRTGGPLVDAQFTVDDSTLIVAHAGGDTVPTSDLVLLTEQNGDRERFTFNASDDRITNVRGTADTFQPGDRWTFNVLDPDRSVDVRLIHDPSGRVLDRDRIHP